MDKNFIKVDDLFRQRLGGAEENERSGAWLNMRDLLDKEMPRQKRIGIFYWRRIFSAVAVLSLVATVCIGSYELSSAFRGRSTGNIVVADVPAVNREADNVFELPLTEADKTNVTKVASSANRHEQNENTQRQRHIAPSHKTVAVNAATEGVTNAGTKKIAGKAIVDRPVTVDGNATAKNRKPINGAPAANNNSTAANKAAITNTNNTANTASTKHSATQTAQTGINGKRKATHSNSNLADEDRVAGNAAATKMVNNRSESKQAAGTSRTAASSVNHSDKVAAGGATSATTGISGQKTAAGGVAEEQKVRRSGNNASRKAAVPSGNAMANVDHNNAGKQVPGADDKDKKMVLNSGKTSGTAHIAGEITGVSADKLATSGPMPVTTANSNGVSHAKTVSVPVNKVVSSGSTIKNGTGGSAAPRIVANGTSANSNESATPSKSNAGRPLGTGGVAMKNNSSENNKQGKRVITKLLVHQRKIKVSENEYAEMLDTISLEKVNMDLGLKQAKPNGAGEVAAKSKKNQGHSVEQEAAAVGSEEGATLGNTPTAKNKKSSSQSGALAASGAASKTGNSAAQAAKAGIAEEATSGEEEAEEAAKPVVAAAPAAAAEGSAAVLNATATEVKTKPAASTKGSGVSLIEKLSLAFNDVKQNAAGARFVPGMTAGINSNFFGPSSFKGFQFGLTGNIIFNNTWNVMTELKYFHRLNNNTSVEDNYYTYTPVGGQYRRDLLLNSYSFSALHSLEMPVAIRYSKGNFNFFTGGNFIYSFSINTGAATVPSNTASEMVAAPGTDTKGTLTEADFRSRFGLGYLLGFSYQVAPNVGLDLRSVQTVWDNAATTGAKSISGQLYKTPSVQLSIMYRLGGNRSKD